MLKLDSHLSRQMTVAEKPGPLRALAAFLAHSGDSWFWLVGLGVVWLVGTDFWQSRAVALGAGVLVTAVIVLLIKFRVKRRRPEGTWGNIYRSTDPHSFPSGHAARSAMLAVMAIGLGPAWFGLLLLVWAPLVPLARVAMGVHYLSDVLAGALLGIGMGFLMLRLTAGLY